MAAQILEIFTGKKERREMEREKEKKRRIKKVPHAAKCIPR
jgi:hypothetical protein